LKFSDVVARTLGHEGGYVNNPKDPGGETKWGISKRAYPNVDIKNLTREQAIALYEMDYWEPMGKHLTEAINYQVFDAAVNHGRGNAIRFLQRAVGVADDGVWGPRSQHAYKGDSEYGPDESDILLRFLAERLDFMTKLSTWDSFGKGWARRIAGNLKYAAADTL
jgi:lysozyme family protein